MVLVVACSVKCGRVHDVACSVKCGIGLAVVGGVGSSSSCYTSIRQNLFITLTYMMTGFSSCLGNPPMDSYANIHSPVASGWRYCYFSGVTGGRESHRLSQQYVAPLRSY